MPKPYMLYPVTPETISVKKEIFEQLTDDIIDRIKEICSKHHSNGILVDKVGLVYEVQIMLIYLILESVHYNLVVLF